MKKIKQYMIALLAVIFFVAADAQTKQWTMEECVDHALKNNLQIQLNDLGVRNGAIDLKQSKANLYPNLRAGGNYGYNWGRSIDPTSNDFISQRIGSAGLNANSSVVLFSGMSLRNQIKQNKLNLTASQLDLEKSKNDVTLDVLTFYLNVIFNKELASNANLQLQSTIQQLDRTTKMVKAGALPKSDKLNLVSQKATNQRNLIDAENRLALSILSLKQLLRIQASEAFDIVTPEVNIEQSFIFTENVDQIYASAESMQPEIKSADINVQSQELGEKIANSALLPTLSLNGQISTNYSDARMVENENITSFQETVGFVQGDPNQPVTNVFEFPGFENQKFGDQFKENRSTFFGLNLSIPIFSGLQNMSNTQRATLTRQQAEITAEQSRQFLRQTIEQAYYDAQAAGKSHDASLAQVEALEESFRIAVQQRDIGALNFVDYQIAENNLFQAKSDLVRNKYDYIFKVKVLDFYKGNPITFK